MYIILLSSLINHKYTLVMWTICISVIASFKTDCFPFCICQPENIVFI